MDQPIRIEILRDIWKRSNEKHWIPVVGTSMYPFLHEGDELLVSHDLSSIHAGDLLVFHQADGLVAHRLMRGSIGQDGVKTFMTKGDNCRHFDTPLQEQDVLGRVDAIRKNGKEIQLTSHGWRLRNSSLAVLHLIFGTILEKIRNISQNL